MTASTFVGRAGDKLEFALREFGVNIEGKICADFGSAVGGFVDCLLQHGAQKVYAVETGYGVLDYRLRKDPRVTVLERTNAMHVTLPKKVDLITIDTSWTRQKFVVGNALKNLKDNGEIIILIKPHYEADPRLLEKGKLSEENALAVASRVVDELKDFGVTIRGPVVSPIEGGKAGNTEYLALLQGGISPTNRS